MLQKRTRMDRIEIDAEGHIFLKLYQEVLDDETVLSSVPHRTSIDPDTLVADQVAAVNADLERRGFPAIAADTVAMLDQHATLVPARNGLAGRIATRPLRTR